MTGINMRTETSSWKPKSLYAHPKTDKPGSIDMSLLLRDMEIYIMRSC